MKVLLRISCQQTCTGTTRGLELMALRFSEKSLYLMSHGGALILINPGVELALHSSRYSILFWCMNAFLPAIIRAGAVSKQVAPTLGPD